jgi:hypothetical protein
MLGAMSTPCILAVGDLRAWKGVPCKADGILESTGPVIIDAIVRGGSLAAGAKHLVLDGPFGWGVAGRDRLDEVDDYLAGDGLSEATPQEILDRHYALYLLDPEASCLRIKVLPEKRWLDPIPFEADGSVRALPDWYPHPAPGADASRSPMPAEVRKKVDAFAKAKGIRWSVLESVLKKWCLGLLGDLSPATWIVAGDAEADNFIGGRVGGTTVYMSPNCVEPLFTGSDGRLRSLDIDQINVAWKMLVELGRSPLYAGGIARTGLPAPDHAASAVALLLSAAYELGSGMPGAHVSHEHAPSYSNRHRLYAARWVFTTPLDPFTHERYAHGHHEVDLFPVGWMPLFLSWLLF